MNIPETFKRLDNFVVPPEFWPAFGYEPNGARFVSLYWEPSGDEAEVDDGTFAGTMDWQAYLMLVRHTPNARLLRHKCPQCHGHGGVTILEEDGPAADVCDVCWGAQTVEYNLGSSDGPATHRLLVDLEQNNVYVGPVPEVAQCVREQWARGESSFSLTPEEMDEILAALQNAVDQLNANPPTMAEIQAAMDEQNNKLEALHRALCG
jgi:hypothetical protein